MSAMTVIARIVMREKGIWPPRPSDEQRAGWRLIELHDRQGVRHVAYRGRRILGDRDLARLKHRLLEAGA